MVELFDLRAVNRAASSFDTDKLSWLNQHYIKQTEAGRLAELLRKSLVARGVDLTAGPPLDAVVEAQRERSQTIEQMADLSMAYYTDFESYDEASARKHLTATSIAALQALHQQLSSLPSWAPDELHLAVTRASEATGLKMGKVAQPLRVAVCGRAASPSIEATLMLAGRERTLERIDRAIAHAGASAGSSLDTPSGAA